MLKAPSLRVANVQLPTPVLAAVEVGLAMEKETVEETKVGAKIREKVAERVIKGSKSSLRRRLLAS